MRKLEPGENRVKWVEGVLAGVLAVVLVLWLGVGAATAAKLDAQDQANLADAVEDGKEKVTLLVAAKDERFTQATSALRSLGAVVTGGDPNIDYVKVSIPVDQVEAAAKLKVIEALDVDGLIPLDDPRPQGAADPIPQAPPGASTPRANPYMPIAEIGAAQFIDANPTLDGRDTVIAILDSGIDLDHPALKLTSEGDTKIIDWFNANPPGSGDGTWVNLNGRLNGPFNIGDDIWQTPASGGPYAFGFFYENLNDLGSGELAGDIDRDGVKNEGFGVIQNRSTKEVYVDLNQNRDFTDETPMLDYKLSGDVGHFGTDNLGTPEVEEVPFVVGTHISNDDPDSNDPTLVNLGIAGHMHGTHVAGIAAAGPMFESSEMTGAAPGAKLMSIKVCLTTSSCTSQGMLDGMVYAAQNGADVANLSAGGLPSLNDGNNARAVLYNNIIDEYGMQIVIAAGNSGPGANTVNDPGVTNDVIAVGASISKETWLANYGIEVDTDFSMQPFSGFGPREDGGFKPEVVAPGSAISTAPQWQPGAPTPGVYSLPPGYIMGQGTSMSAPQVTGAVALLVSAYKDQFGSRPDPALVRNALVSNANFLPGIEAHGQGAGQIDVAGAWQQMQLADPTAPYHVTSSVEVNTRQSELLETPHIGRGIHDREGVITGEDYTRTYTFERTTGPAGEQRFDVSWLGDVDSFESPDHVHLALNTPTTFTVTVKPDSPGIHAAILRLDDPDTDGIDLTTMNTVFAPEAFEDGVVSVEGTLGPAESHSVLVRVPKGATKLSVDFEGGGPDPEDGQLRFRRVTPMGTHTDGNSSFQCYIPDAGGGCPNGDPAHRELENPMPGVWEIAVEARRDSSAEEAPYKLTVALTHVEISPDPDDVSSKTYSDVTRTYTLKNQGVAFTGRLFGGRLSSSRVATPSISHEQTREFDIELPEEVSSFTVSISAPEDPQSDIDLFLYDCRVTCSTVDASQAIGPDETVQLFDPPAGNYKILVYGFSVPKGTMQFELLDRYAADSLGRIVSAETEDATREPGETWTATATVTSPADPGEGRFLSGRVWVETENGDRVGSGDVNFRIDNEAPTTTITVPPPAASTNRTPTIEFTVSEPGTTTYCAIDDGAFEECESPYTTPELEDGQLHTISVKATDGAGNEGEAATTDEFAVIAATALAAEDAVIARDPGGDTAEPRATLTNARTDAPLAGRTVHFTVGFDSICNAVTNAEGLATCEGALPADTPAGTTYEAKFVGGPLFEATSASALLIETPVDPPIEEPGDDSGPAIPSDSGPGPDSGPGSDGPGEQPTSTICPLLKLNLKALPFNTAKLRAKQTVRVPGFRVRLHAGRDVMARIQPRIRYRVGGKTRTAKLKSRTIRIRSQRQLRFRLPARVKRQLRKSGRPIRGTKVTLVIRASLAQTTLWPACRQGPVVVKLSTEALWIAKRASLSRAR